MQTRLLKKSRAKQFWHYDMWLLRRLQMEIPSVRLTHATITLFWNTVNWYTFVWRDDHLCNKVWWFTCLTFIEGNLKIKEVLVLRLTASKAKWYFFLNKRENTDAAHIWKNYSLSHMTLYCLRKQNVGRQETESQLSTDFPRLFFIIDLWQRFTNSSVWLICS